MGIMVLVLLGFGAYYLWEHLYGGGGAPSYARAAGSAALHVVSQVRVAVAGADARL